MDGEKRYKRLNKEVLNRLLCAVLGQASKDAAGKDKYKKDDAVHFSKTEYCELICYVCKIDYELFKRCMNIENIEAISKDKALRNSLGSL